MDTNLKCEGTISEQSRTGAGRRCPTGTGRRTKRALSPDLGESERNFVLSIAMKYVKDAVVAEDVAQEALLLAHHHRDSFRGDSRFSTWLYRVATTTALMHLRKQRRRSREVQLTDERDAAYVETRPAPVRGPDGEVAHREAMAEIAACLHQMGSKYQRIFWMQYMEGYSAAEIASALGLSVAAVKTRAHRAKVAVRDHLRTALPAAA